MRNIKYALVAFMAMILSLTTLVSCKDDGSTLSKAVLASASTLNFAGQNAEPQTITIYADADWVIDAPDWVTVTPSTGTRTMDVTVSVSDNMRDGSLDNIRKADLVFKGSTLASQAHVKIIQDGDKFRDIPDYTVSQLVAAADASIIIASSVQVAAVSTEAFIASDGKANILVEKAPAGLAVGDKVAIKGEKGTENGLPAVNVVDELKKVSSGTFTYPSATDISSTIATYTSSSIVLVSAVGVINAGKLAVGSFDAMNNFTINDTVAISLNVQNPVEALKVSSYNGHIVKVTGYYTGLAKPVLNVMGTAIEDKGLYETVYFSDDFSWVKPFADGYADDSVGDNNASGSAPNSYTYALAADFQAAFTKQGYVDLNPDPKVMYVQKYYLKFGKTSYNTGIKLPAMAFNGTTATDVVMTFNWCAHMTGSGNIDQVQVVVEVTGAGKCADSNAAVSAPFATTQTKGNMVWQDATVKILGVTKDTRIIVRPENMTIASGAQNRWYIDNIKIVKAQ